MGDTTSQPCHVETVLEPEPVSLHIYNLGTSLQVQAINQILRHLGTGAFHCGVEVFGREFSFRGGPGGGTGIFWHAPRSNRLHKYVESLPLGKTYFSEKEVQMLVSRLQQEWLRVGYNILTRNCCHFCDTFCKHLGVESLPDSVLNLAKTWAEVVKDLDEATKFIDHTVDLQVRAVLQFDHKIAKACYQAATCVPCAGCSMECSGPPTVIKTFRT